MKKKSIIDVISDVAEACRDNITVLSAIESGSTGVYTLTTTDNLYLNNGDFIQIANSTNFNGDFEVSNVNNSNDTFTITHTTGKATETFAAKNLSPYFYYEKWRGAEENLQKHDFSHILSKQKYPLIFLLLDIEEQRGFNYFETDLKIFFIEKSKQNADAAWRKTNIFDNILQPIYEKFIIELKSNPFVKVDNNFIEHTYVERYFLGSSDRQQNKVNDIVEAIECSFNVKFKNLLFNC